MKGLILIGCKSSKNDYVPECIDLAEVLCDNPDCKLKTKDIMICDFCNLRGMHVKCANYRRLPKDRWLCGICALRDGGGLIIIATYLG